MMMQAFKQPMDHVLELIAGECKALVLGWRADLVEDLVLDGCDGVGGLRIERDGVAAECPHKNLKEERVPGSS